MKAYARIRSDQDGPLLAAVNLKGRGTVHCDRIVAQLATALGGDYWEINYGSHDPLILTTVRSHKGRLTLITRTTGSNFIEQFGAGDNAKQTIKQYCTRYKT